MHRNEDEGQVYYREIQKNAYLKRIPNETGRKLMPLGHKKPPLKPMWTLFCVHNGRVPYLEQYPEAQSTATLTHRPVWRLCLKTTRHVTASVKPYTGNEHDFLIDTDQGPVRMVAPDWNSMQDWVTTLRNKLHELKVLCKGENVYCAAPAAAAMRAGTRDPASPLPPTPPVPPDRVPGIELNPALLRPQPIATPPPEPTVQTEPPSPLPDQTTTTTSTDQSQDIPISNGEESSQTNVDISEWDSSSDITSIPSSSSQKKNDVKKSLAKICGQNVSLDGSIFKRNETDSDEEFRIDSPAMIDVGESNEAVSRIDVSNDGSDYKQRLVVNSDKSKSSNVEVGSSLDSELMNTNITVIQVSNKGPPHTAIPVLGVDTDVFNFDFKHNVTINNDKTKKDNYVNIVHTENTTDTNENGYGTVFGAPKTDYGHLSLTTTTVNLSNTPVSPPTPPINVSNASVNLTSPPVKVEEGIYERLCMASTSTEQPVLKKVINGDKSRKSSLPNLDSIESNYEHIFPKSSNDTRNRSAQNSSGGTTNVLLNSINESNVSVADNSRVTVNRPRVQRTLVNPVSSANVNSNSSDIRTSVGRAHSQNAYDTRRDRRPLVNTKSNGKVEKQDTQPENKPIWKRGLTEFSLLSRLKGFAQKRSESPNRNEERSAIEEVKSPVKVVRRSRPEARNSSRRRSTSLSEEPRTFRNQHQMQTVRVREALQLQMSQSRGCVCVTVPYKHTPVLVDYEDAVWVCAWSTVTSSVPGMNPGTGDRVAAVRGTEPRSVSHAGILAAQCAYTPIKYMIQRVPLAKIFVLQKNTDGEFLGIKLDSDCAISSISADSPASRGSIPSRGWAVTHVNSRPINLVKGGEEDMNRLASCGKEVSVIIQPAPLVAKMRHALKSNKSIFK